MPMAAPMIALGAFQGQTGNDTPTSKSVTIKMGVDELRTMITEVVQKAVQGLQAGNSNANVGVMAQENAVEEAMESMQANELAASGNTLAGLDTGDEVVAVAASLEEMGDAQDEADLWATMKE
jgi:hypothetical protein